VKTPRESVNRLPPRKNLDGWWTSFRSGLWRLKFQLSPEGNKRYDDLVTVLHDTKISVLGDCDDEAWYLLYLGTKPGARGKGYAKKLLDFMVQRVCCPSPSPPPSQHD
jgi:ribosomal protein S18 acetylase RimI-like enzyme